MLETIALPGSGRVTTRLGFGGSGLMGGMSERESLRLLETAFDAGIRHFDVAPAYGHGQAERCLGKFLRGKRDQVTVATKYGILPPARSGLLGIARGLARPAIARLPAVRKRVARAAAGLRSKGRFSGEEARLSLARSLRELRVEAIDVWLLHEAAAGDLDNSDLLPLLKDARKRGLIGAFGVGGDRGHLTALWQGHREYCGVLQFGWSVLERNSEFPGAFAIHYRAISGAFGPMRRFLQQDFDRRRQWSNVVDCDLSDSKLLAGVLLQAALAANPGGMVLFSSRVPEHIRANVQVIEETDGRARGMRFLELIASRPEIRMLEKS
jgi:D-threo-aldose 1-dehydrogenase